MVSLPTSPNISCGTGELPVAVVATYAGGLIPIPGAKVDFSAGTFIFAATNSTTTNIVGLAQTCHQAIRQVSAYIQKDGIDFGSGVGARHLIGNSGLRTGPYMFPKVVARTQAPGAVVPSLPPRPTLPTIPTLPSVPTPPPVSELCSKFVTKVDSINHPAEITDFNVPFYVYLRGIKEVCQDDPTNPAFINKVLKGTKGTITLGNLSSDFYLTSDGIVDIDLSKLVDLKSLSGAPSVPSFGVQIPQTATKQYKIGVVNCLNKPVAWLPKDPNFPDCEFIGQQWFFAADKYGNRISKFYKIEADVYKEMGGLPTPANLMR